MHPIEIMIVACAIVAPVTVAMGAFRWKNAFASRPSGLRYWLTLFSLGLSAAVMVGFTGFLVRAGYVDFNSRYQEYLLWLRLLLAMSCFAVLAAAFGRGAGRVMGLFSAIFVLGFIVGGFSATVEHICRCSTLLFRIVCL